MKMTAMTVREFKFWTKTDCIPKPVERDLSAECKFGLVSSLRGENHSVGEGASLPSKEWSFFKPKLALCTICH